MKIIEWLESASKQLGSAGVDSPRLDAQLLVAYSLGRDRSWVLAHVHDDFPGSASADRFLARRLDREPLAYIIGMKEFFGRQFHVDERVLVPRPETETLVSRVLLWIPEGQARPLTILDVGTGSGCIGITLAMERPICEVTGIDIDPNALAVAEKNAAFHQSDIELSVSDLFENLEGRQFDLVVSNPPYVSHLDEVGPEVREFEPHHAVFADANGLAIYRRLAATGGQYTNEAMIVEIGFDMYDDVVSVFGEYGWHHSETLLDLSGIARCLTFLPPPE